MSAKAPRHVELMLMAGIDDDDDIVQTDLT